MTHGVCRINYRERFKIDWQREDYWRSDYQQEFNLDGVTLAYGKKTVVALVQQYSQWKLAEKSWSDFNVQDE